MTEVVSTLHLPIQAWNRQMTRSHLCTFEHATKEDAYRLDSQAESAWGNSCTCHLANHLGPKGLHDYLPQVSQSLYYKCQIP